MTVTVWATVAAFTAAAFSFINALVTARANSGIQRTQWRRTVELEAVTDMLKGIEPFLNQCARMASIADAAARTSIDDEGSRELDQIYATLVELKAGLERRMSELELIAGDGVVRAAQALMNSFEGLQHHVRPAGPYDSKTGNYHGDREIVLAARQSLVDAIRVELGADRRGERKIKRSYVKVVEFRNKVRYRVKHRWQRYRRRRNEGERRNRL